VGTDAGTGSRELTQLREVVRDTAPASAELEAYLEKVHQHAYRVTDEDVAALKAAGVSEDEIFEQTVAAAIAEGLRRLDAAERVL
jgi:alkylhydroperoxidase family enzyme